MALVGVQMAPVPDQTYLHGLAAGVGKLLRRLAGAQTVTSGPLGMYEVVLSRTRMLL